MPKKTQQHASEQTAEKMLVYNIFDAETGRQESHPVWPQLGACVLGNSEFLKLGEHPQMTTKHCGYYLEVTNKCQHGDNLTNVEPMHDED